MISSIGLTVPSTLLTWAILTNFVRSLNSFLKASISKLPSSSIGTTFKAMPFRAICNCQGTMFEWCSISETITSSPAFIKPSTNEEATRLMLSVVPRVKIISLVDLALINFRNVSRALSCNSVACCDNQCTPL